MDNTLKALAGVVVAVLAILAGIILLDQQPDPLMRGHIWQDSAAGSSNYDQNITHVDQVVDSWHMDQLTGSWHIREDPDSGELQMWAVWRDDNGTLHEAVMLV